MCCLAHGLGSMGLVLFGSTGLGQPILGGTALLRKGCPGQLLLYDPSAGISEGDAHSSRSRVGKVSVPGLVVTVNVTPLCVINKHFQL